MFPYSDKYFVTGKKINNYFNKIDKKRMSQRSKIFDLRIIFTKNNCKFPLH